MGQETYKYRKKIVHEDVPDSVCPAGQQEEEFRAQWKRDRGTEEGQQERVFSLSTQWSVVGTASRRVVPLAPREG